MENTNIYIIPMVDKTFEIIEYMYQKDGKIGISQISKELNLPKATIYRILTTLRKWGYVEKTEELDKYMLGKSFIKLGSKVSSENDITSIAVPLINKLAKETGESINLGILYNSEVVTVYNTKGEDFYLISNLIPVSPLNCSAMGKLFLSKFSDKDLKEYFESNKPEKRTVNSISDLSGFLKLKEEIERDGISYDKEEYEYGLSCIAAPIYDANKNIIAAISISGPTTRLNYKGRENLQNLLISTAKEISKIYSNMFLHSFL
ncbi:MAG: IclR family transcriptional regulator [Tissierellia bacterium]|nr:IclR family transcriptional regulator [Tissierellia bacterium]